MLHETKLHTFEINGKVEILRREIENIKNFEILEFRKMLHVK